MADANHAEVSLLGVSRQTRFAAFGLHQQGRVMRAVLTLSAPAVGLLCKSPFEIKLWLNLSWAQFISLGFQHLKQLCLYGTWRAPFLEMYSDL